MSTLFWILLAVMIGYGFGYANGHATVAEECRKLGGFYVGKTVFKCT